MPTINTTSRSDWSGKVIFIFLDKVRHSKENQKKFKCSIFGLNWNVNSNGKKSLWKVYSDDIWLFSNQFDNLLQFTFNIYLETYLFSGLDVSAATSSFPIQPCFARILRTVLLLKEKVRVLVFLILLILFFTS